MDETQRVSMAVYELLRNGFELSALSTDTTDGNYSLLISSSVTPIGGNEATAEPRPTALIRHF